VVQGIVTSPEYRTDFTQSVFRTALHRQATTSEVSTLVSSSMTLLQIEASVYGSPEFLNKG
jgi:hypothetical protein